MTVLLLLFIFFGVNETTKKNIQLRVSSVYGRMAYHHYFLFYFCELFCTTYQNCFSRVTLGHHFLNVLFTTYVVLKFVFIHFGLFFFNIYIASCSNRMQFVTIQTKEEVTGGIALDAD